MSNGELFKHDADKLDPAKVLANMEDPAIKHRWEGTLKEMVEIAEAELAQRLPDKPEQAAELARAVVFAICNTMGGSVLYLPRGTALQNAIRDAALFRDWRDHNIGPLELVRKYKITSPTVYAIIARQRALHRRNEPDLFGFEGSTGSIH